MPRKTPKILAWAALICLLVPAALRAAPGAEKDLAEAARAIEAHDYQGATAKLIPLSESLKSKLPSPPVPERVRAAMMPALAATPNPLAFIDAARQALAAGDKEGAWFNTASAVASTAAIVHSQPARTRYLASAAAAMEQDSPVRMHIAARTAFGAGYFADALEYCKLEMEMWRRHAMGQPMDGVHWHRAQSLLGQVHLAQGNIPLALESLMASVKKLSVGKSGLTADWGAQGPGMALAKKLIEANRQTEVADYLALCEQIQWDGRDKIIQWRDDLAAGRVPLFDPISLAF